MGAGLARQAAQRHPQLPRLAGQSIRKAFDPHFYRWVVIEVGDRKIGLIQTKTDWRKPSTMDLIMGALWSLSYWMNYRDAVSTVAMPMIGCGLGGLPKKEVLEAIKNNLWQVEERVELWDP